MGCSSFAKWEYVQACSKLLDDLDVFDLPCRFLGTVDDLGESHGGDTKLIRKRVEPLAQPFGRFLMTRSFTVRSAPFGAFTGAAARAGGPNSSVNIVLTEGSDVPSVVQSPLNLRRSKSRLFTFAGSLADPLHHPLALALWPIRAISSASPRLKTTHVGPFNIMISL